MRFLFTHEKKFAAGMLIVIFLMISIKLISVVIMLSHAEQQNDRFIGHIANREYQQAFDLCMEGMQDELLGNPQALSQFETAGLDISRWEYIDQSIEENRAYFSGVFVQTTREEIEFNIWLKNTDKGWLVGEFWIIVP